MNRTLKSLFVLGLFAFSALTQIGCDQTVSEKKTTQTKPDGTTVTDTQKKTVNSADGTVKTTNEKEVDRSKSNANP